MLLVYCSDFRWEEWNSKWRLCPLSCRLGVIDLNKVNNGRFETIAMLGLAAITSFQPCYILR